MKFYHQRRLGLAPKRSRFVHSHPETEELRALQRDRTPYCYWCGVAYGAGHMAKTTMLDAKDELVAAHVLCASLAERATLAPYHVHRKRGEIIEASTSTSSAGTGSHSEQST